MKTYYIRTKEPCPQCNGEIAIRNPAWDAVDEYVSSLPADMSGQRRDEAIETFCARHFGTFDPRRWPPEDRVCPKCDGAGIWVTEEDISEIISVMLSLPETVIRLSIRISMLEENRK